VLEIRFGTDGWRAVIGEAFTFHNVKRVAQAVCTLLREKETGGKRHGRQTILVGHDWRFMSERFAASAAGVMSANGFKTRTLSHPATSPMLSFAVHRMKARLGIMITASHNPPHFNGFKLKDSYGGPMDDNFIREVEQMIGHDPVPPGSETPQETEVIKSYGGHLARQVDLGRLKSSKIKIAIDCMHGPSAAVVDHLFGNPAAQLTLLRRGRDPFFGGVNPEPIEKNLALLQKTVPESHCAVGLAFDGDADRLGVVDEKGRYLPPHVVFPLLLLHAIENRKWKGKVVETVSMGYLPERIARHYGIPFQEVPVGFKYVSHLMRREPVIAGGGRNPEATVSEGAEPSGTESYAACCFSNTSSPNAGRCPGSLTIWRPASGNPGFRDGISGRTGPSQTARPGPNRFLKKFLIPNPEGK